MLRSAIWRQGLIFSAVLAPAVSLAALASIAKAAPAPAEAPVAASPATDVLSGKGLTKTGTVYTLAGEKEVLDALRPLLVTKAKFDKDSKERAALERQSSQVKSAISQADLDRRTLNEKLSRVTDATQNNHLIAQINILTSQIDEATKYKQELDKKISDLGDETREAYIQQVMDLSTKAEAVSAQYKDLAADTDVKAALTAAKGRLGPTEAFTSAANRLKIFHKDFNADVIKLKMENGVPNVEVTLNGKLTRTMTVDSGAGVVVIPADLAKDLQLIPGPNDPEMIMQLADGKSHKAHQMTLKSIRLGPFTVENVECAVLEADLISAEPLLGGSFLQNFIYKLDTTAGELHLTRVGAEKGAVNTTGGKPKAMENGPGK